MRKYIKFILLILIIFCIQYQAAYADNDSDKLDELKKISNDGHYRFISVDENGFTPEMRKNLEENDKIYIDENPKGSITIEVLDAKSYKPVKDAICYLNYSAQRNAIASDGSQKQTANPFIVFKLGKTPDSGIIKYDKTYFFKTYKPNPNRVDIQYLMVTCAAVIDENPEVIIDFSKDLYYNDKQEANAVKEALTSVDRIKFNELVDKIKSVPAVKDYNSILYALFSNNRASFSENTLVEVSKGKAYDELINSGKGRLSLKELREYIDTHKEIFNREVAARKYEDFGGFVPTYKFDYRPTYEHVVTYKDGTEKVQKQKARVGLNIFKDAAGGTRCVRISDSFNYTAYIYHPDYNSGKSVGTTIHQDLIDKDVKVTAYLLKDMQPVVAIGDSYNICGTIKDANKNPVKDAVIKITGTDLSQKTDETGYFLFHNLPEGTVNFEILNSQDDVAVDAKALYNDKKYNSRSINLKLTPDRKLYRVDFITDEAPGLSEGFPSILWVPAILLILFLIMVIALIINRNKLFCDH